MREKRDESRKNLEATLDDAGKDLLFHYEEALSEISGLEMYEMFRCGVKTGAALLRELTEDREESLCRSPSDNLYAPF